MFIYLPVSHVNMCFQSDSTKTYRELFQTDVLAYGVVKYVLLYIILLFTPYVDYSERSFFSVNNLSDSKAEQKPLLIEIICGREKRFDIRSILDLKRVTEGDNVIGFHNILMENPLTSSLHLLLELCNVMKIHTTKSCSQL